MISIRSSIMDTHEQTLLLQSSIPLHCIDLAGKGTLLVIRRRRRHTRQRMSRVLHNLIMYI